MMNKKLLVILSVALGSGGVSLPAHADEPVGVAGTMVSSVGHSTVRPMLAHAPLTPDSGSLLVKCGQLIDGYSQAIHEKTWVLIENGRIQSISPTPLHVDGIARLDLSEHTCLPGLIDMHTHILEGPEELTDLTLYYDDTLQETLDNGARFARATLESGVTTARNLGVYYAWAGRDLRDAINAGSVVGPRLLVAGYYLTIPGGGGDLLEVDGDESLIPAHLRSGVARSAQEFASKTHEAIDGGADVIKVIASGAVLAYGGVPGEPEMSIEELQAVVSVAKPAGIPVAAHAHGAQSIIDSIMAGATTIEHATYIDDEGIRLAIENDVALSMDIGPGDWMIEEGRKQGWVEEFLRKTIETTQVQRESFQRAHEAGVTIVFGTDAGIYPHGMAGIQFAHMVEWGMSPMQAIQAATSVSARVLGRQDSIGALRAGLLGDLIAVKGNPLDDITELERVDAVIKGGLVFRLPEKLD